MGSDDGSMTLAQASALLQSAIDFGNLAAQQAPSGHPIFTAILSAQVAQVSVQGQIPFYSLGNSPAPAATVDAVNQAVSAIYDAAATLQVSPDQPLPPTVFPPAPGAAAAATLSALPWAYIGAAAAGLAWLFFFFRRAPQ